MDPFAYLSVLTSIVLALGIARVLTGLGTMLQARGRLHLYWVHLVWTSQRIPVYGPQLVDSLRWHSQSSWTFFLFLFVLLSPTVAFLLSVLLFPEPFGEGADLKQHFFANHRWFFALAALLSPIDAVDTLLKGFAHFVAQGPLYVLTLSVLFMLNIMAAWTKREDLHSFFAIFFLVYLLVFISINLRLLT